MSASNITNPELHGIATEIAKKCAGLPLLILKVAADLRGKESYAWSDMLNRLSSLENTDLYEKVHKVIESSYENLLDVEAKSAFLLCALFGDSNIEIHKLLMYSVGLGLFKHIDSIEGLRNRVLTLIDKLKDECLLLDGDRAGFVKLHDVVREVALVITSKVQHVFVGSGKVRFGDFQNKDRTRFSLPYCDISELPEVLKCPEAEVFSMIANHDRLDIPCSFFEGSPKLKVVDFTGVCFVSGLPSSLGCLVGLQALCLHRCELHNVAIVSELKQLEVLSFAESNIEELPEEIKGLTRLKLLDLRYCYNLKVIPANVLTNLSLLEELYIFNNGFHGWEAEGNASLVELKNLSHLTTLEICVRGDKLLPKDWFFDGVQNYRISIGEGSWIEDKIEPLRSRRILKLELKASIGLMNRIKAFVRSTEVLDLHDVKGVENLLCDFGKEKTDCGQLQILKIFHCDTLKSLCLHSFPQLQQLEVSSCRKMEAISGEGFRDEVIEFTQLNSLKLNNLPNLVSFCKTSGMISFPNLTRLVVSNCMSLKYIFTTLMVKSLKRLKELEINYCKLMEEIVLSEKVEEIEEEEEDESINRIVFPELDCLKLGNLENLKRFSSGYPVDFPSLRVLEMNKCRAIDKLVSKFMNRNNSNESFDEYLFNESVAFFNIEELSLDGMDRFKYIFPALIACGLPQLRKLEIYKCGVEAIIANAKDETTEIKLPKLSHLSLSECHNMIIISANNSKVSFPSLTRLEIYECKGLKYVFTKSMVKSLERLKELEISRCESMEEIILSEETEEENINKIVFPELDCLRLINLQKLKRFSRGNPIDFSSLRILNIYECRAVEKWVSKLTNGSNSNENVEEYLFDEMVTFSNLEKLLIGGINKLKYVWNEDIDSEAFNVKNLQFINVSRCPDLKYVFPASIACGIPQLRRLRIYGCGVEVIIANAKDETIEWPFLTKLEVSQCYNLISISANNSKVTFPSLEHLSIAGMDKLKYLVPASVARSLLQLRKLEINKCGVEVIIANDKEEKIEIEWPNLTHLKVLDCQKLIKFGSNNFKLLPNVEVLELDHRSFTAIQSDELPVDFSLQLKRVTLNSLSLQRKNINRLFLSLDDEKEIGDHEKKYHLTLEHLELRYVSNLKHILKKDSLISPVLQHLQSLAVLACDDLMNIAPSSASFQYLTTLKVEGCKKTTSLVTASTAKTMAQLVKLTVSDCKMMEEIIAKDGNAGFTKHDVIVFEKLKYLELISLGRLDSFCSGNYNFNFPLLEKATVKNCSRMKIFCSGIVSSPKLEGIKIKRMGLTGMTYITQLNAVLQRIKQASCERL